MKFLCQSSFSNKISWIMDHFLTAKQRVQKERQKKRLLPFVDNLMLFSGNMAGEEHNRYFPRCGCENIHTACRNG